MRRKHILQIDMMYHRFILQWHQFPAWISENIEYTKNAVARNNIKDVGLSLCLGVKCLVLYTHHFGYVSSCVCKFQNTRIPTTKHVTLHVSSKHKHTFLIVLIDFNLLLENILFTILLKMYSYLLFIDKRIEDKSYILENMTKYVTKSIWGDIVMIWLTTATSAA